MITSSKAGLIKPAETLFFFKA